MTEHKMTQSAVEVKNILQRNYVNEGHYSHVSLIIPRGKFSLSSHSLMEDFWLNYCRAIQENPNIDFGIAEVPKSYIPILIDVDLKFRSTDMKYGKHFYSEELVKKIITVYQHILREYILFEEKDNVDYFLNCFWLDKEPYCVGDDVWKNGFHIHFPNIFIGKVEQETVIIPAVKKYLDENYSSFEIDSSIIDARAVGNTWLLYGSVKAEKMKPYKVAAAYGASAAPRDIDEVIRECKIFDFDEAQIKIGRDPRAALPRILSIFPSGRRCFEVKKQEKCIRDYCNFKARRAPSAAGEKHPSADMPKIRKLVDLLSPRRAEGHDDWMTIGWILYNLTDGSEAGLDLWVKFSANTDDHDENRCIYEWMRMVNKGTYSLGSLIYYAKKDNPSGFKRFVSVNNSARENYSEYGLAEIFYEHCQEEFVYCGRTWYMFRGHFWEEDMEGIEMKKKMISVLKTILDAIHREKTNQVPEDEDGKREGGLQKDPASIARSRLNTIGFINCIVEFAKLKFNDKSFSYELNTNRYLVGFANGVYDLKDHIFREGRPSDYISNHMKINYREFEESDSKVQETMQFLEKILLNERVRRYFLDVMSEAFIGYNHRKKVYFWTGDGDNGKSVMQMLCSKMLGPLCAKAPTTLITSKRGATGSANAELARLGNGVRVVFLEEPDPSEAIYTGTFKHLSGNDDFYARDLYQSGKDVREIAATFRIIMICNDLPKIHGGGDKATWNRVRVIPYASTFSKDAPVLLEEQLAKATFPIDTTLDQKIPSMTEAFAWILLNHLKKPRGEDPPEVLAATQEYQVSNDLLVSYMKIHVEEDEMSVTNKFEFYEMYKDYCKACCSGARPLTFVDFIKCLIKKIGQPNTNDGEGWKGYCLKEQKVGIVKENSF